MAQIIDALLMTMGLDASGFEKNAEKVLDTQGKIKKQATETTGAIDTQEKKLEKSQVERGKQMELRSKQIALGVTKLRNELLGLAAVVTGGVGLKAFFTNAINSAAGLDRMSANLGMSAKDLSMWQLAAKNAGGTAEGMAAHIKQATSDLAAKDMGQGLSSGLTASLRYGVTSGDLKDTNTLLMAQADILKKMYAESPTKAMEAAKMMGVDEETFNLLKQGSAAVMKLRQDQAGLADEMANLAKPAEQIRKDIDALGNSFNSSGLKIVGVFLPAIKAVADELKNFAGFLGDEQAMDQVSSRIAKVLAFFGNKEAKESLAANERFAAESKKLPFSGGKPAPVKPASTIDGLSGSGSSSSLFDALEKKHGLPTGLLDSVWAQESGRGKNMLSPAGAKGHFQFMDPTAKQYGLKDPNNLEESAGAAARMYADLLKQNGGNLPMALAGYNWGQGNVQRKGMSAAPAETRNYISSVMGKMGARNAAAAAGMSGGTPVASGSGSTTEVNVGQITVNTQATDAPGIARSITGALNNQYSMAAQANTGVS